MRGVFVGETTRGRYFFIGRNTVFFVFKQCFKHLEVKALKLLHSARTRSPGAFDVVLCSASLDAAGSLAPKSDRRKAVDG